MSHFGPRPPNRRICSRSPHSTAPYSHLPPLARAVLSHGHRGRSRLRSDERRGGHGRGARAAAGRPGSRCVCDPSTPPRKRRRLSLAPFACALAHPRLCALVLPGLAAGSSRRRARASSMVDGSSRSPYKALAIVLSALSVTMAVLWSFDRNQKPKRLRLRITS